MKNMNDLSGKEWLQNSFSIWRNLNKTKEEKSLKHPASFSVSMAEKVIKCFTVKGATVFDPFNGIGTTTKASQNLGRRSIGIELNPDFSKIAKERLNKSRDIKIIIGDSFEKIKDIPDNTIDLCLTSPPYWDILNMKRTADGKKSENYSNSNKDIGNISEYSEFLKKLNELFFEVYRVLKPDRYCIINVMDIRKKSKFYPLHQDLSKSLEAINFIYDDIIIWDRQDEYNNMKPLGYPSRYRINKVHEFLLIMYKPSSKKDVKK